MQRTGSGSMSLSAYAAAMPAPASSSRTQEAAAGDGDDGNARRRAPRRRRRPGALPCRVCASSEPSPVTTRSAPGSLPWKPISSSSSSMPGSAARRAAASAANPTPPAAPAPAADGGVLDARRTRPRASTADQLGERGVEDLRRPQGSRPSAGRRPRRRRSGPSSGLSTSLASSTLCCGQRRVQPDEVDAIQPLEGAAAGRQRRTVGVERAGRPSAAEHAGAAVGARAAADRRGRCAGSPRPGPRAMTCAESGAGRRQRRELPAGQPGEPAGVGQLDDGTLVANGVRGVDRLAGRTGHPHRHPRVKPAPSAASRVPSPPSATGTSTASTSGDHRAQAGGDGAPRPPARSASP